MTTLTDLEAIQSDLDSNYDRGAMYLAVYEATWTNASSPGSAAAVVEGNISTFSGLLGGTAFLANYYLAEEVAYGGASYSYSMTTSGGTNDIFKMSESVADGFIDTVINNFTNGYGGNVGVGDGITAAQDTWHNQEPLVSGSGAYTSNQLNENLETQFPGMFLNAINSGGTALVSTGDFATFLAGVDLSADGNQAALAGIAGSILFGKSASDFTGLSGIALHDGPDSADSIFLGMQGYITQNDSTAEGSKVVMIDSSQLSVTSSAWENFVGVELGAFVTLHGPTAALVALGAELATLNWDAYRSWSLMSDFRAQLLPGSTMQYDFVQYAQDHGSTAAQQDFWGYTESLLGDPMGIVRNAVLNFNITQTGTSGTDHLYGGSGSDILHGGDGNDVIHGGWGNDSLYGDGGNDVIYSDLGSDSVDGGSGSDTANYSNLDQGITVTFDGSGDSVQKGGYGVEGTDTLTSMETIVGTNHGDEFFFLSPSADATFKGGDGSDYYEIGYETSGSLNIVEAAAPGVDRLTIDERTTLDFYGLSSSGGHDTINLAVESDWNSSTSTFDDVTYLTFGTSTLGDGYGIEDVVLDDYILRLTDLYYWLSTTTDDITHLTGSDAYTAVLSSLEDLYVGGTGGTGAGGGTLPTYDGSGNVTSMQISPAVGGSPISYAIADVVDHPLVLTSFSESYSGGTYTSTTDWQTYEQAFNFIGGITASDVRLTASGSQGAAALTINIDSLGFSLTISNFETGQTISGIEVYNSTLHGLIQDASGSTLTSTGTNTFAGSYLTLTGLSVDPYATVSEHYYLEALNFTTGSGIDLTAPITFTGTDSGETLTGLDARADIIYGMGGDDYIYGYGGNDTLIGGADDDQLYGGAGDDTYVFAAGWGSDTIHENTSEGTDTLHFTGIAPSDIRMYTDAYGYLHLVQISDPSNSVTVIAAVTGDNNAESTVGSYVESVTFDSSYSTTWDLTGGLHLTGDNSGDSLYGTAYNDVITGGTGDDYIYGNAGNDTINGGTGSDNLYGGPGDDTYVFSSGFGSNTVHESLSEGSDTIHLTGIDPADVRLWTDAYGSLHIEDTTHPSHDISVVAGVTGDNNAESTIGSYVEQITFDSSYSTTWDLTGGLHLTGDNSGDSLYGTAYNDVITGGTGDDYIYGNAGNDTISGGAGSDNLYGGPGDDTFVFSSGFGSNTVHESLSEGSDTIHLTGIDPADVRLWTDAYGSLHIEDTTHPSHDISVVAGVTGDNNAESTIGSYVEQITFDSSYSTTWDLTGGLHITGDNSGDILYGTAHNDVITGGTGDDYIYGNAGNDTITGGTGSDNLYGGPGDDTFVFSSGFGSSTVHESLSEGSDTIHLTGINPADVHLSTDSYGYLHIEDTTNPSYNITVNAGVTGDNNAESTIGSYVEQITFDSSYSTTWDLTGGLNITGDNSGDSIYGTAHGDTITGGTGVDYIYGNAGDDVLYGAGGNDNLTGGPGADTFLFKAATAESGVAAIADFNTSDGDKIDLADVISTYNPLTMLIANFVQLSTSGSDTQVKVDTDGSGTSYTQIATITGVTGLSLTDLITDGNLIVHHT